jgi:hypothetical protein
MIPMLAPLILTKVRIQGRQRALFRLVASLGAQSQLSWKHRSWVLTFVRTSGICIGKSK